MSARTRQRDNPTKQAGASFESLTVGHLMRRSVVTVSPDYSLRALIEILDREGISGMPVVSDDGDVVGVVSMTDVVRFLARNGVAGRADNGYFELPDGPPWFPHLLSDDSASPLEEHTVGEIMMPARFTVRADATVDELARFLLRCGIHRALVFDSEGLAGIVTTVDVLRAVAGEIAPT